MITAQDQIKAMVSTLHQSHLKKLDFRKSAHTWIRSTTWPQVVNVQLSQWNSTDETKITVNLGIYIDAVHHATEGLPLKGTLKEYDCDVRARIGSLQPGRLDKWWTITPLTNASHLADEIFSDIQTYGLPWFDRLVTYEAVAEEFVQRKSPFRAALTYALAGNKSEAEKNMADAFHGCNQTALPGLIRLAHLYSIPLPGE